MDKSILMEKVIDGLASAEEQRELDSWIAESAENRREFEDLKWLNENTDNSERDPDDVFYDGLNQIKKKMKTVQKRRRIIRAVMIIAGILVLLTILYFLFHQLGVWKSSGRDWNANLKNTSLPLAATFTFHASYTQI